MTEFRHMWDATIAQMTPQPWEHTTPGGITLTVIPEGLSAAPGDAEVLLIVTVDKSLSARVGVTTTDLPDLITALTERRAWDVTTLLDGVVTVTYPEDEILVVVTETVWDEERRPSETTVSVRLPQAQRLPLASAVRRARDVALGWED